MKGALALASLAIAGCSGALAPLPEIVIVVDTDLPIPFAASRLRVDLYDEGGAWFASTDVARPDARDWPVSFSVYADEGRTPRVWVRLRAYAEGRTRDYRGERPRTLGGPIDTIDPMSDAPRLIIAGEDVTPPSEPDPLHTIDRLALLELAPDLQRKATFSLRAACVGTSSILGEDASRPTLGEAATCVDTEKTRAPVELSKTDFDDGVRAPTAQGSWLAGEACPPDDGGPRVCVPGGATVLGSLDLVSSSFISARPPRLFGARRFLVDRDEVTVGRYREALAAGFEAEFPPYANDKALAASPATRLCTWSTKPMDREDYAINCIAWQTARAFCVHAGGDLPSEAQWEHAATVAGHAAKARYPWGNETPSCDDVSYGGAGIGTTLPECPEKGTLPRPLSASAGDIAPSGVVGLGGGVSEWTLDEAKGFSDACWGDAPIVDPRCGDPDADAKERVARGSYYAGSLTFATTRYVLSTDFASVYVGFRCAYAVDP